MSCTSVDELREKHKSAEEAVLATAVVTAKLTLPDLSLLRQRVEELHEVETEMEAHAEEMMDRLSDELSRHGDIWRALREMTRRGMQDPSGRPMPSIDQLMQQTQAQRNRQLQQFDMDSVMDDLKQRLNEILQAERAGIQKRLEEASQQTEDAQGPERAQYESLYDMLQQRAQRNMGKLDALPESVGGAIRELLCLLSQSLDAGFTLVSIIAHGWILGPISCLTGVTE